MELENRIVLHEKTDEEIINAVLTFIMRGKREWTLRNLVMIPNNRKASILDKLFGLDLIQKSPRQFTSYADNIEISKHGLNVIAEYGSFVNYKTQNDLKIKNEKIKSELENTKLMAEIATLKGKDTQSVKDNSVFYSTIKAYCTKCRQQTRHSILLEKLQTVDQKDFIEKRKWQVIECGCDTISFRETYANNEDWGDEGEQSKEIVYQYPEAQKLIPKPFNYAPIEIKGIYRETVDAYNNSSLVLCSAGCRAVVEGICNEQKIAGKDLKIKIEELHSKGILTKINAEALQNHRFIGNKALHSLHHLSINDLQTAIEIIEHTIENIYELKEKGNSLKGNFPKS